MLVDKYNGHMLIIDLYRLFSISAGVNWRRKRLL